MMLRRLMLAIAIVFLGLMPVLGVPQQVSAQAASTSSAVSDPDRPLFTPQSDDDKFRIILPKLGWHFTEDENLVQRVVNFILPLLTLLVGLLAFGYFILGGIRYLSAGPDPSKTDMAKRTMIGAVIGMVLASLSYVIVMYVIHQVTSL